MGPPARSRAELGGEEVSSLPLLDAADAINLITSKPPSRIQYGIHLKPPHFSPVQATSETPLVEIKSAFEPA